MYSTEQLVYPQEEGASCRSGRRRRRERTHCAGFGSCVGVTASFGLIAASWVLRKLVERAKTVGWLI